MYLANRLLKYLHCQMAKLVNSNRKTLLNAQGVQLKSTCWIAKHVSVDLGFSSGSVGEIYLAEDVRLEPGVILNAWGGKILVERNVFIGPYVVIYGHGGVIIGSDSLISMHCCILSSNHTVPNSPQTIRSQPDILLPTKIGRDVWLGANVTILGGVTIGDGCVVGAGAVVTKDLPPYSIAVGVPAKVINTRI
jgi:acetyltransferase-like isoleucine patch superfamily enzyme